jgi:hypothetical protein
MKFLWVKSDFLHPTDRGGQVSTPETLRYFHRRHKIHFIALRKHAQGVSGTKNCTQTYAIPHYVPKHRNARF